MIYITQLIFVRKGKEAIFLEFEALVIPLMEKYNGQIVYRIRPTKENFVSSNTEELPYEVHLVSFDSEDDLNAYMKDDSRLEFIHLKEASVKSILLVKGKSI